VIGNRSPLSLSLLLALLFAGPQGHAQTLTLSETIHSPTVRNGGQFGTSIATIGDVTGDDTPEYLVGASLEDTRGRKLAGRVHLFDGETGRSLQTISSPNVQRRGKFGEVLAGTHDTNEDGTPDYLVGAYEENVDEKEDVGRVYLFNGKGGQVLQTFAPPTTQAESNFGSSVAEIGDLNGDGSPDFLIGAPGETVEGQAKAGRAYVFSGDSGELLQKRSSPNPEQNGAFGATLTNLGDTNGDATADYLIGAWGERVSGEEMAGRVYLFDGNSGEVLHAATSPNPEEKGLFGGGEITKIEDVSGDDRPDYLVGALGESVEGTTVTGEVHALKSAGRAYLVDGRSGQILQTVPSPHPNRNGYFSQAISTLEDVNGDDTPDFLVGAPRQYARKDGAGWAYLFSGNYGQLLDSLVSPNLQLKGHFGAEIETMGALTDDGRIRFAVGAPREGGRSGTQGGQTYLYTSSPSQPTQASRARMADSDAPNTSMMRPNDIAVVIGIKEYDNKDVPNVDYALRDARAVRKHLTRTLGFREENIIFAENATGSTMERIFGTAENPEAQLHDWIRPNESDVFVYYSGHGAPDPESEKAYFVPSDANPNYLPQNGYPVNQLYENLATLPAESVTVVLDACFSGVSDAGELVKDISPAVLSVENPILGMENGLAITAGTAEQVSTWYNEEEHGLFTYYFLQGLQGAADADGNRQITAKEMGKYLLDEVSHRAQRMHGRQQTPQVVGQNKDRVLVQYENEMPDQGE